MVVALVAVVVVVAIVGIGETSWTIRIPNLNQCNNNANGNHCHDKVAYGQSSELPSNLDNT